MSRYDFFLLTYLRLLSSFCLLYTFIFTTVTSDYQLKQKTSEAQKIQQCKCCGYNNPDEDNNPRCVNNVNSIVSSFLSKPGIKQLSTSYS